MVKGWSIKSLNLKKKYIDVGAFIFIIAYEVWGIKTFKGH